MNKLKIYLFLFLLGLIFFLLKGGSLFDKGIFTFSTSDIPFPTEAEISDIHGEIRMGVEKVVHEKFFITYSKAEGNQSYFGTFIVIENLKQNKLNKNDYKKIWLTDNLGNKYEPLNYYELQDFPRDNPLGWKLILFNKFMPVEPKASFVNINVEFDQEIFKLKEVRLP